jgi:ribosome-associated protein
MDDLPITEDIVIPGHHLSWKAVRASGPGGQNVNKVATKVELCFDLDGCTALADPVKARLRRLAARHLDADKQLVVTCQTARTQRQNLGLAVDALAVLVRRALVAPKKRRKTKPSRAAKAARVADKLHQAKKKQSRRRVTEE